MELKKDFDLLSSKDEHRLHLHNRSELEIHGVKEVDSFDQEEFLLETNMGYLVVRGENLQLQSLNVGDGIVHIHGKIYEFMYIDEQEEERAKGLFSKLFK